MRSKCVVFQAIVILSLVCGVVYSAPVDVPLEIKQMLVEAEDSEGQINFTIGAESDLVLEHSFNVFHAELDSAKFSGVKFVGSFDSNLYGEGDLYSFFGQAADVGYTAKIADDELKYLFKDSLIWTVGCNFALDAPNENGIKPFVDIKYRSIEDMQYRTVDVGSTQYKEAEIEKIGRPKYREWQAALGLGKKFKFVLLYAGIKYSDVSATAKVKINGNEYFLNSARSDNVVGGFAGCSIIPCKEFALDVETRFNDERAFTFRGTYKF
ncbi:MAG: hypothetical protein DRP78_04125 [Candidatus Omnitrophota bacterium]|nr:MAG: hypothetical protein DRP78_04125 [Candidatus Omnitrophota bacterium]